MKFVRTYSSNTFAGFAFPLPRGYLTRSVFDQYKGEQEQKLCNGPYLNNCN